MNKHLSIKEALDVWRDEFAALNKKIIDIHPDPLMLQKLALGVNIPEVERWYAHLVECPQCNQQWIDLVRNRGQALPLMALKVAGSQKLFSGERKIEYDNFVITFRENLQQTNSCLIILSLKDKSLNLEGNLAVVRDGSGKPLLAGEIINSRLAAFYDDVKSINWDNIIVEYTN